MPVFGIYTGLVVLPFAVPPFKLINNPVSLGKVCVQLVVVLVPFMICSAVAAEYIII